MVNLAPVTGMLKLITVFPASSKGLVVQKLTHVYVLWVAFACVLDLSGIGLNFTRSWEG